ncbi:hypothetical protein ACO0LD_15165 [Undibacterium sp. Ji83W]|uniref:hypothetical protein n=1 Tax=Undibacterium sp. Ji83W TaxID=3413043 RepID=UPI003BF0ED41
MSKLLAYLNSLDKDVNVLSAHKSGAKAAMENYGLNAEEQEAVLSGNKESLAGLLGISADEVPAIDITESTY